MQNKSFSSLYGLKGAAILLIVFFHTLTITPVIQQIPLSSFIKNYGGTLGNALFFMMSGFLISSNYLNRIQKQEIPFRDFLLRRLRKIYPVYLISNLLMLGLEIFRHGWSVLNLDQFLLMVFLQHGGGLSSQYPYNYPTWFLSTLFLCYILFFVISYHAKNSTHNFCSLIALVVIGYILVVRDWDFPFLYKANGLGLFAFFIGCILAQIQPSLDKRALRLCSVSSIFIMFFSLFLMLRMGVHIVTTHSGIVFTVLVALPLLILALYFYPFKIIFQSKPMVFLGKISTAIFIWHAVLYDVFCKEIDGLGVLPENSEISYMLYLVFLLIFCILFTNILDKRTESKIH